MTDMTRTPFVHDTDLDEYHEVVEWRDECNNRFAPGTRLPSAARVTRFKAAWPGDLKGVCGGRLGERWRPVSYTEAVAARLLGKSVFTKEPKNG